MIYCKYSTNEMYHEYKNGIPISEIVNKTGIKRKTWNKRFERLEKKNKVETINNKNSNYSELIIHEKSGNNDGDNSAINNNKYGDIGDNLAENVANANSKAIKGKNERLGVLAWLSILLLIGLILLFKWIYENHDKWPKMKND